MCEYRDTKGHITTGCHDMRSVKLDHVCLQNVLCASFLAFYGFSAAVYADEPKGTLRREDADWLQHLGFGVDDPMVDSYQNLGRDKFLRKQLSPGADTLPTAASAVLNGYEATSTPLPVLIGRLDAEQKHIKSMPAGPEKTAAIQAQQRHGNIVGQQAQQAAMIRAIYGPNQLKERLVWFWLNHFSIYLFKDRVRWFAADYEEHVIRDHALGKFRDLVMASLQSPAMLEFLDNSHNASGHLNENYARELMELHTLGVDGGYSQKDVQQLAAILTGVGIAAQDGSTPILSDAQKKLYVKKGMFEFDPRRHDFGNKVFLGQTIKGEGFAEVEQAVDILVKRPQCARFISLKLAKYFVSDKPSPELIKAMVAAFESSDGDIATVMSVLFRSKDITSSPHSKFRDPMLFISSAMRISYGAQADIADAKPLFYWAMQMGEAPFGRITPDGWATDDVAWTGSGQLAKRFEIAKEIGSGASAVFGRPNKATTVDKIDGVAFKYAVDPFLSSPTRTALQTAGSPSEWNTILLSSPELNFQ